MWINSMSKTKHQFNKEKVRIFFTSFTELTKYAVPRNLPTSSPLSILVITGLHCKMFQCTNGPWHQRSLGRKVKTVNKWSSISETILNTVFRKISVCAQWVLGTASDKLPLGLQHKGTFTIHCRACTCSVAAQNSGGLMCCAAATTLIDHIAQDN